MLYATIELIDNKVVLVRAKTKSGRLLPDDIDTTTINQAMTDILNFVQAQEPTEVEEALQIKEQANQEVAQVRQEVAQARQEVAEAQEKITSLQLGKETLKAELDQLIATFKPWTAGESVVKGDIRRYENGLYEVIQDHTTQADWQPNVAASLWRVYTPNETLQGTEIIPDFVQPVPTNPYMTGDKVVFEGKVYESTIDNNVWSPIEHPQGWQEEMEAE